MNYRIKKMQFILRSFLSSSAKASEDSPHSVYPKASFGMKRRRTKFYRAGSLVSMLGIMLLSLSCGGAGTNYPPVTLKIWKPFVDSGQLDPLIQAYEQKYPNVHIEYT